jgi:predicted glycosyltransferase
MSQSHPHILLYSHDTYGLGHLRRTLAIANQLAFDIQEASQLLITGSMVAGAFELPPHFDLIKLPALTKRSDGRYMARALPMSLDATISWREQIILQAAIAFEPDLVLVDKTPAGVQGELLPTLQYLKSYRPNTRLILGMRDIEDDPKTTCAEWAVSNTRQLHEEVYDGLLYYGEREIFDPVREYAMSRIAAKKLMACGYLGGARPTKSRKTLRSELGTGDQPLIVVTVGGGGDGFDLLKTYYDALAMDQDLAGMHSLLVTGPLMTRSKCDLLCNISRGEHLHQLKFTPDLVSYLAAADLVVSMAGYNTVCEILSLGVRALLVPRVKPRQEQLLRAQLLAERGLVRALLPDDLSPERLASEIKIALNSPPPKGTVNLDGLKQVSRTITNFLSNGAPELSMPLVTGINTPLHLG